MLSSINYLAPVIGIAIALLDSFSSIRPGIHSDFAI